MKKFGLHLSVLLLFSGFASAQITSGVIRALTLPQMVHSRIGFHMQLKADQPAAVTSIIQVGKLNDTSFVGTVMLYVKEFVELTKERPIDRFYYSKEDLTKQEVREILKYAQANNITDIPTDSVIKGWKPVLDGTVYEISTLDNGIYSEKSYWSPDAQEGVKEAKSIQRFVDSASAVIKTKLSRFNSNISFEAWSDGFVIVRKKLGAFKKHKYKKERNLYRKQEGIK
ncbi:hypothetical protein ACFQZS_17735 [Mucilaginibacter calamicampi]|uniref:Uncharacterized protein n=1 Tax=Mucilaginibacter calamicampi TaxID=1302352 RepID=A0ABW2Z5L4_9SPHI